MNTNNNRCPSILQKCVSLLLCLSMIVSFAPSIWAAEINNTPETSNTMEMEISDEFELTEEYASFLMSSMFGENLQPLYSEDGNFKYALTENNTEHLISSMLDKNTVVSGYSNDLPEGYIDDSNEDINEYLKSLPSDITTFSTTDVSATKVDLVFIIDSTGSMSWVIRSVKNNVAQFAKYLADKGVTLRLGLIDYRDITADGYDSTVVHTKSFSTWFNITSFIEELNYVSAYGGGDTPETAIDALGHLTEGTISWNSDAYKFAMLITDADYKTSNQHGISSMNEMIEKLQAADIQVSVVTEDWCMSDYGELAAYTGGVQANINDSFGTLLEEYADSVLGSAQTKKNYTIQVNDITTGLPVQNAKVTWNGGSTTTNSLGIATITTRNNPIKNFKIQKNGYITYYSESFDLEKNGCVSLLMGIDNSLDDYPSDIPIINSSNFVNMGSVKDTFKGPSIKIFGKEYSILSAEIGLDIPIFNGHNVTVKHDFEDQKYSVLIGKDAIEGTDPDYDPYWKDDYQKYKSLVQTFSKKSSKEIYDDFRTLRKDNKSSKGDIVFPVDLKVAGYLEVSYATGKTKILEGGIIIAVSTKELPICEVPLGAPWLFLKVTFSADVKGAFNIVQVESSGKITFPFNLKEIVASPSLTGTLNLGVPKLVSVGGGLNASLDFKFTGLPPKKLEEILTIEGDLNLVCSIKLLGFKATPKLHLCNETLYPSKSRSSFGLMVADIEANDFTPISPPNYLTTYSLGGLSDTLTFEKAAYEDSTPQIVPFGDGWMMVWIDEVAGRDETDYMALYYSVYTEADGWSTPLIVDDDGTGDFAPSLVIGLDGEPVVVWQNSMSVGSDTLEERLENMEILVAEYNSTTNTFESAVSIPSTEGLAPLAVQAVCDDYGVSVYWLENENNNPFLTDGEVSIMKCDILSGGTLSQIELEDGILNMNGFAAGVVNGEDTYAYATSDGTYHWLCYDDEFYAIGSDCRSTQFVDGRLYWSDSEGLKSFDGTYIYTEGASIPADFVVAINGSNRVILLNQITGDEDSDTSVVYASISTFDGEWSSFTEIKQYDGSFTGGMSAIMTDSGLIWVAAKEISEVSSLIVDEYTFEANLNVSSEAYVSTLTRSPGEDVEVLVDLYNDGLTEIYNLKARLADGTLVDIIIQDEDGEDIVLSTLSPGESVTAAIGYTLPTDLSTGHGIIIDIVSDNGSETIEWGTTQTFVDGSSDLVVDELSVIRNEDGTATVYATILNNGSITAKAPTVSLTMEKVDLVSMYSDDSKSLDDIVAGGTKTVQFDVLAENLVASNPYDYKRFTVNVSTLTTEYNVADNSDSILLAPVSVDSIAFTEDDVSLDIGTTYSLDYQLFPANAASSISFMSNNTEIVTVSDDGVLTPIKAGTTTVSVMAIEAGKIDEITVTVNGIVDVGVNSVSISPSEYSIGVGETVTLTATVLPSNATNTNVIWNTDTPYTVSIEADGSTVVVTGLSEGTGYVTVITEDGSYTDTAVITVVHKHSSTNDTLQYDSESHWDICDDCGEYYDISDHSFDNECDNTCNTLKCNYIRSNSHTYEDDKDCTTELICSTCKNEITAAKDDHTFDGDCDDDCNTKGCSYTRTITHTPSADDGDCTTQVTCSVCGEVAISAQTHAFDNACDTSCNNTDCTYTRTTVHKPNADDGDCTTAVACSICKAVTTEASTHAFDTDCDTDCNNSGCKHTRTTVHIPSEDDGDCSTAILCSICAQVMTKAQTHTFDNDCDSSCNNSECNHTRSIAHSPNADDNDCTTEVTCYICGEVVIPEKAHSFDNACDGRCNNGDCTYLRTTYHTYSNDYDSECDACGYKRGVTPTLVITIVIACAGAGVVLGGFFVIRFVSKKKIR